MRISLLLVFAALAACGTDENLNRVVGELASDRIELTAETNEPITAIAVAEGDFTLHRNGRGFSVNRVIE